MTQTATMSGLLVPLEPEGGERPVVFADRVGRLYSAAATASHKKTHGQYLTPIAVADFLGSLAGPPQDSIRILDPGAGSGILACAAAEALSARPSPPARIHIDAHEIDPRLAGILRTSLAHLRSMLATRNIEVDFRVSSEDFVLSRASSLRSRTSLFGDVDDDCRYNLVISNPPYFKLSKSDPRARAADDVVHGQPNIYALFMAISASLLEPDGELVFITPRSFASGPYFKRFRQHFFERMRPEAIHVFESRRDAFSRDGVLQENMILKARRSDHWNRVGDDHVVRLSVSQGSDDIAWSAAREVALSDLLDMDTKDKTLRIPSTADDGEVVRRVDGWTGSLRRYGMEISTGPVVAFRAEGLISATGSVPETHAPLLWLQNVGAMRLEWPTAVRRKPQFISLADEAAAILVRDRNYVLLRRFSAKEEQRRLTAAPLLAGRFGCDRIGLENHLNYIHRPGGALSEDETVGLAALYNSSLMDRYFRTINGSTQVGATELRKIPLPPLDAIVEIGRRIGKALSTPREVDEFVNSVLARPSICVKAFATQTHPLSPRRSLDTS